MTFPVELTRRRFLQGSVAGSLALAGFAHPAGAQAARPIRTFSSGEHRKIWSAAFSPDGRTIVSSTSAGRYSPGRGIYGSIIFWEASTGKRLRTTESTSMDVYSVAFSPDGATVLSGGRLAAKVDLWNAVTGGHLRTFKEPDSELSHEQGGEIRSVVFSPDGRSALSASREVNLWHVATGSLIRTFGEGPPLRSIAFSPDGRTALSGGFGDDALMLWDLATGEELRVFKTSSHEVLSVAFSPDGRTALSGGFSDNNNFVSRLTLWDVATGDLIRSFGGDSAGHATMVNSVAFSPDGRTVLSGGGGPGEWLERDTTLRLWDVATGKVLRIFEGHPDSINSVAFSPDGRTALAVSSNDIWLWDLSRP